MSYNNYYQFSTFKLFGFISLFIYQIKISKWPNKFSNYKYKMLMQYFLIPFNYTLLYYQKWKNKFLLFDFFSFWFNYHLTSFYLLQYRF